MNNLKHFRIFCAILFMVATVVYLFTASGPHSIAVISKEVQIIPSMLASTMGATLVWLLLTFLFGRIYCSTVCPVGTLFDIFRFLSRKLGSRCGIKRLNRCGHFRPAAVYSWRRHILWIYVLLLVVGMTTIASLIEPWSIMQQIAYSFNPTATQSAWISLGVGTATGAVAGIIIMVVLALCGMFFGRDYCNMVCPVGTILGAVSVYSLWHIEIDPDKCSSCMKCEDICRGNNIKVVSRYVDNTRCIRCFDCLNVCQDDAIKFQRNRNRPATPLFQRRARSS